MEILLTEEERRIREILIEIASKKNVITYSELIIKAKLDLDMNAPYDRGVIGRLLGSVSAFEYEEGRPMLSSVVITVSGKQGDGFFKLAEELGFGDWKKLKKGGIFEYEEMSRAHNYWSKKEIEEILT